MVTENKINEKWEEVLDFARQHATKQGMRTGINWLKDAFNEFLELSDHAPGYGMGGEPGSHHNRRVLAEKILLELGDHVGGRHLIDKSQEARLKDSLDNIVDNPPLGRGLKI